MKPIFFATPGDFRKWLEKNHETATELLVAFYKKSSGKPSITWREKRLARLIEDSENQRRS